MIFDFHPLGGTGVVAEERVGLGQEVRQRRLHRRLSQLGSNGDNAWNVGYCCQGAQQNKVDDVQFTRDMIKLLEANACVDPKRIYASGCSNGGGMSYMLACKAADVIAAVAPVDFRCITGADPASASSLTPTNNTACTCTLPRPISVTAFDEGQDNSIVPYNGGQTVVAADCPPGGSCKALRLPERAGERRHLGALRHVHRLGEHDPNNSICQTYMSCADNTEVTLCTAPSGSHCGSYGAGEDRRHGLDAVPEGVAAVSGSLVRRQFARPVVLGLVRPVLENWHQSGKVVPAALADDLRLMTDHFSRARKPTRTGKPKPENSRVLDLDRYTVAYLVWTANKLSRGASQNYLKLFGVGVETWRCLVLLAIHNAVAAQQISQVMGMDKASVSRCFKIMQRKGLILMGLDASDGRVRIATLTPKGRALHDQILEMALERERVLLSVLSQSDRETLLRLLKRIHENLATVETATADYIARRYPRAPQRRPRAVNAAPR